VNNLQALDIIIMVIIGLSTLMSLARGFTREVLSLASWVLAAYAALFIGPLLIPMISDYIAIMWLASTVAFGVVFVVVLIISSLLAQRFAHNLKNSSIGALDRTLGIIFGALRGGLIVSLAYLLLLIILPRNEQPNWLTQARLYPLVQTGAAIVLSLVPEDGLPIDIEKLNGIIDTVPPMPKLPPETIPNALDALTKGQSPAKEQDKGKDNQTGKGYTGADRAVLDSLIKGTQKVE